MTIDLDLARRSLEGLSVGDALGERFFGPPGEVVLRLDARAVPPGPWRWTDDTAMALSVVEVLAAHGGIDPDALALAFARRYRAEAWRGYGGGAHDILRAIGAGGDWRTVARDVFGGQGSWGNGGAMRAGPLGAALHRDLARVEREARASASVTHAHPEGQDGAVATAVMAAWAARGGRAPLWGVLEAALPPGAVREGLAAAKATPLDLAPEVAAARLGAGEQVRASDTVPFCAWVLARGPRSFEEAFWWTVRGLGDRDTTCAIVGSVVALLPGGAPPEAWVAQREALPLG